MVLKMDLRGQGEGKGEVPFGLADYQHL